VGRWGNDLAISACGVNAPQIKTTRLSCTLSILAVSRPKEVILRKRIVVEVPLRDLLHGAYRHSPASSSGGVILPKASLMDEASNVRADRPGRQDGAPRKIGCTREAQGWGWRRDSGAGTRRLEADTADEALVVDGGRSLAHYGRWRWRWLGAGRAG
jgi:hypothetical protein